MVASEEDDPDTEFQEVHLLCFMWRVATLDWVLGAEVVENPKETTSRMRFSEIGDKQDWERVGRTLVRVKEAGPLDEAPARTWSC